MSSKPTARQASKPSKTRKGTPRFLNPPMSELASIPPRVQADYPAKCIIYRLLPDVEAFAIVEPNPAARAIDNQALASHVVNKFRRAWQALPEIVERGVRTWIGKGDLRLCVLTISEVWIKRICERVWRHDLGSVEIMETARNLFQYDDKDPLNLAMVQDLATIACLGLGLHDSRFANTHACAAIVKTIMEPANAAPCLREALEDVKGRLASTTDELHQARALFSQLLDHAGADVSSHRGRTVDATPGDCVNEPAVTYAAPTASEPRNVTLKKAQAFPVASIRTAVSLVCEHQDALRAASRTIGGSASVYRLLKPYFAGRPQEEFCVLLLNRRNAIIGFSMVSRGTADSGLVHPRDVFRTAVASNAVHVVLAHNHPSGRSDPSANDTSLTERLCEAGMLLGITVLDHVICCDTGEYYSYVDDGRIGFGGRFFPPRKPCRARRGSKQATQG